MYRAGEGEKLTGLCVIHFKEITKIYNLDLQADTRRRKKMFIV